MPFTHFWRNRALDLLFGGQSLSVPATLYVALSTSAPAESGTGVSEPAGAGYARVAVANNKTNWSTSAAGALENTVQITFPTASGSWGTLAYVCLYDAASGGNLLAYTALSASKAVGAGQAPYFAPGDLDIQIT